MNDLEKWAIDVKVSLVNYQETYGDNDFSNGQVFMIDRVLNIINKINEDSSRFK
jgi:hypothetical protein